MRALFIASLLTYGAAACDETELANTDQETLAVRCTGALSGSGCSRSCKYMYDNLMLCNENSEDPKVEMYASIAEPLLSEYCAEALPEEEVEKCSIDSLQAALVSVCQKVVQDGEQCSDVCRDALLEAVAECDVDEMLTQVSDIIAGLVRQYRPIFEAKCSIDLGGGTPFQTENMAEECDFPYLAESCGFDQEKNAIADITLMCSPECEAEKNNMAVACTSNPGFALLGVNFEQLKPQCAAITGGSCNSGPPMRIRSAAKAIMCVTAYGARAALQKCEHSDDLQFFNLKGSVEFGYKLLSADYESQMEGRQRCLQSTLRGKAKRASLGLGPCEKDSSVVIEIKAYQNEIAPLRKLKIAGTNDCLEATLPARGLKIAPCFKGKGKNANRKQLWFVEASAPVW